MPREFGMAMDDAGRLKGGSRHYIMRAVEASLKRLRTDWIDLYQLHNYDPLTPIKKKTCARSMILFRAGKVRYIGCSNLPAWRRRRGAMDRQNGAPQRLRLLPGRMPSSCVTSRRTSCPQMGGLRPVTLPLVSLASWLAYGQIQTRRADARGGARLSVTQRLAERYMTETNWGRSSERFCVISPCGGGCGRCSTSLSPGLPAEANGGERHRWRHRAQQVEQNVKAVQLQLTAEASDEIDAITGRAKGA